MNALRKSNRGAKRVAGKKMVIDPSKASSLVKQFINAHPTEHAFTVTISATGKLRVTRARKKAGYKIPPPGYFNRFYTHDVIARENVFANASGIDPADFQ